jgi:hypothetical protein
MNKWTAVLFLVASAPSWAQVTTVELDSATPTTTFSTGQSVVLDLNASNFAELDGGGVDINFDPSVLTLQSVSVNTALFDFVPFDSNGTIDNTAGSLTGVDFFALLNNPSGDFTIATLDFVAKSTGSADLSLSVDPLNPFASFGNQLNPGTDFFFQTANISVSNLVAPVPEPSTFWLIAVAGLVMLSLRKRLLRKPATSAP